MKYKALAILKVAGMILLPMLLFNLCYWLLGAFVAWEWNPKTWWLLRDPLGRILVVILELVAFMGVPKFWGDE